MLLLYFFFIETAKMFINKLLKYQILKVLYCIFSCKIVYPDFFLNVTQTINLLVFLQVKIERDET